MYRVILGDRGQNKKTMQTNKRRIKLSKYLKRTDFRKIHPCLVKPVILKPSLCLPPSFNYIFPSASVVSPSTEFRWFIGCSFPVPCRMQSADTAGNNIHSYTFSLSIFSPCPFFLSSFTTPTSLSSDYILPTFLPPLLDKGGPMNGYSAITNHMNFPFAVFLDALVTDAVLNICMYIYIYIYICVWGTISIH